MTPLTPATLRPHLDILDDGDAAEDVLLQTFIDAAWKFCCRYTRRDLTTEYGVDIPADLFLAHSMIAAHFFMFREGVSQAGMVDAPMSAKDLLADFRDLS